MNDRDKIRTALSGTFACLNTHTTALQEKEPELCQRLNNNYGNN